MQIELTENEYFKLKEIAKANNIALEKLIGLAVKNLINKQEKTKQNNINRRTKSLKKTLSNNK